MRAAEMDRSVTLTESELAALLERAVARALAQRPTASTVTYEQAGEMLGCSGRTVRRMKPPVIAANRIPYAWVLERLSSR
jgi:hypothetical protein